MNSRTISNIGCLIICRSATLLEKLWTSYTIKSTKPHTLTVACVRNQPSQCVSIYGVHRACNDAILQCPTCKAIDCSSKWVPVCPKVGLTMLKLGQQAQLPRRRSTKTLATCVEWLVAKVCGCFFAHVCAIISHVHECLRLHIFPVSVAKRSARQIFCCA